MYPKKLKQLVQFLWKSHKKECFILIQLSISLSSKYKKKFTIFVSYMWSQKRALASFVHTIQKSLIIIIVCDRLHSMGKYGMRKKHDILNAIFLENRYEYLPKNSSLIHNKNTLWQQTKIWIRFSPNESHKSSIKNDSKKNSILENNFGLNSVSIHLEPSST